MQTTWDAAQRKGSLSIYIWESTDLINWGSERLIKVEDDEAGMVWAPDAIWDASKGENSNPSFSKGADDTDCSCRPISGSLGIQIRESPVTLYYSLLNQSCSTPRPTLNTLAVPVPAKSGTPTPATSKLSPRRRRSSPPQRILLTSHSYNCRNTVPTAMRASSRTRPPSLYIWSVPTMASLEPGHDLAATRPGFTLRLKAHTPTWIIKLMERCTCC